MATWTHVRLAVIGVKKDVDEFNQVAMQLPVLSDYVIERNGKPVLFIMFEDMAFTKPRRWRNYWWRSFYEFDTRDPEAPVKMIRQASKAYPDLCFRLDWDCEHVEFRTHLIRLGTVQFRDFDAYKRRSVLFQKLTGGVDDEDDDVDYEIDDIVAPEMALRFEKLWRKRLCRILDAQRNRGESKKTNTRRKERRG